MQVDYALTTFANRENFKGRIEQAYGPQAVAFQDVKVE